MSINKTAIKYGSIFGGVLVVYGIIFRLAKLDFQSAWTYLFYLLLAAGSVRAVMILRRQRDQLRFFPGLGVGLLAGVIGGGIYCLYVFVYNAFIDNSLLVAVAERAQAQLDPAKLSAEELAVALQKVEALTRPGVFAVSVFVQMVLVALVVSLIAALALRKTAAEAAQT
jgi:uncharacterized membrane protein